MKRERKSGNKPKQLAQNFCGDKNQNGKHTGWTF
jgi:hypothetical protein